MKERFIKPWKKCTMVVCCAFRQIEMSMCGSKSNSHNFTQANMILSTVSIYTHDSKSIFLSKVWSHCFIVIKWLQCLLDLLVWQFKSKVHKRLLLLYHNFIFKNKNLFLLITIWFVTLVTIWTCILYFLLWWLWCHILSHVIFYLWFLTHLPGTLEIHMAVLLGPYSVHTWKCSGWTLSLIVYKVVPLPWSSSWTRPNYIILKVLLHRMGPEK